MEKKVFYQTTKCMETKAKGMISHNGQIQGVERFLRAFCDEKKTQNGEK